MSCNRENVTWQSVDGRWNIGFYEFWDVDTHKEDWDYEWDVEYGSDFHWVSSGHPTPEAARDAWRGANPGGSSIYEYNEQNAEACAHFDKLAQELRGRERERRAAQPRSRW